MVTAAAQASDQPGPQLLTVREAAARLRVSADSLYRLTAGRQIAHVRLGRRVLLDPADLDAWLDAQRVRPQRLESTWPTFPERYQAPANPHSDSARNGSESERDSRTSGGSQRQPPIPLAEAHEIVSRS
jgi:excisionase family DNA binding protein